jgi:hypothetical protein
VPADPARIGMAFPGTFMLDASGRVTSRFFENLYFERNTVSSILMRLGDKADVAGSKVSTAHLDLTTYTSDASVSAGNRFTLAFDIQPRKDIHVYAPGASSYRVVSVKLTPQPFLRPLPVDYPPSEIYFFKPLNERVPVYRKPFTLRQEVVLENTRDAQAALRGKDSITLTGVLDYQACDDAVCFTPVSVPLSWTLAVRPLDFERSPR